MSAATSTEDSGSDDPRHLPVVTGVLHSMISFNPSGDKSDYLCPRWWQNYFWVAYFIMLSLVITILSVSLSQIFIFSISCIPAAIKPCISIGWSTVIYRLNMNYRDQWNKLDGNTSHDNGVSGDMNFKSQSKAFQHDLIGIGAQYLLTGHPRLWYEQYWAVPLIQPTISLPVKINSLVLVLRQGL